MSGAINVSHELSSDEITRAIAGEPMEGWVNASGIDGGVVQGEVDRVGRQLAEWVLGQRRGAVGRSSMFDRYAYVSPDNPYQQMETARKAVANDDVVGGAVDVTEGLIFEGLKWESTNADDADIMNQLALDMDLDSIARNLHRELFTYSTAVIGEWWGQRQYTVSGRTMAPNFSFVATDDLVTGETYVVGDMAASKPVQLASGIDQNTPAATRQRKGGKRRKQYKIFAPVAYTFLDPLKVVPVGSLMFGQEQLAWHCTREEMITWEMVNNGLVVDAIMSEFFVGQYIPSALEMVQLAALKVNPLRLMLLNPDRVWRINRTRPDYMRFADIRLKGIFRDLDMKQQLMEADRAVLIGAANYILLVKKGSADRPATPAEISNLQSGMKVVARLPVIISDDRLNIEIITPKQDYTLDHNKYDLLDRRILARCLGSLQVAAQGQRAENSLTIGRTVGRLLESQREQMKRKLEMRIARAIVDHPLNAGIFSEVPAIAFTPPHIQLDNEVPVVQAIMQLRQMNEISRESVLEYFGFDQDIEAMRREHEADSGLDDTFQTQVPFNSPSAGQSAGAGAAAGVVPPAGMTPSKKTPKKAVPAVAPPAGAPPVTPGSSGATGGRPKGGGTASNSVAGQVKKTTPAGNAST